MTTARHEKARALGEALALKLENSALAYLPSKQASNADATLTLTRATQWKGRRPRTQIVAIEALGLWTSKDCVIRSSSVSALLMTLGAARRASSTVRST